MNLDRSVCTVGSTRPALRSTLERIYTDADLLTPRNARPGRRAGLSMTTPPPLAVARARSPIARWADQHAIAVPDDLDRRGADLAAFDATTRGAVIVGLGEAAHQLHEVSRLKLRYVQHLVRHSGFRAVAWEDDWSLGTLINDYLLGRRDDIDTLVGHMSKEQRTGEVVDVFTWLRDYNRLHPRDPVRFAGVEYFATRPLAYDAVEAFVAEVAPDQLGDVSSRLAILRPRSDDINAHLTWYLEVTNKAPYVRAAAEVHQLVAALPTQSDRHDVTVHHARQIRSFYKAFSLPWPQIPDYRDARAAENVQWWKTVTRSKLIYWAAGAHVADARVQITEPGQPETTFLAAGSRLKRWYRDGYVRVGFTFDHGRYEPAPGQLIELPPPAPGWVEHPLTEVARKQFLLGLDSHAPRPVRDWLTSPLTTRGLPEYGHDSMMTGGTLQDWYDVLIHCRTVTPAALLSSETQQLAASGLRQGGS
ncbi:MAG: hypothetical protein GEU98_09805 [Pseudonocardiaceae bacterium]|nr:hypothetical protein [Pseudonocardiaceae bacterium]